MHLNHYVFPFCQIILCSKIIIIIISHWILLNSVSVIPHLLSPQICDKHKKWQNLLIYVIFFFFLYPITFHWRPIYCKISTGIHCRQGHLTYLINIMGLFNEVFMNRHSKINSSGIRPLGCKIHQVCCFFPLSSCLISHNRLQLPHNYFKTNIIKFSKWWLLIKYHRCLDIASYCWPTKKFVLEESKV